MEARGIFTNDTTDTMILRREAFPIFAASALGNVSDDDLWDYVTANETMKSASLYPDFGSYLRDKLTPEGWQYLQSVRAYEGDLFEVDADSYVEFWSYEKQDTGYQYRPVGGMSDFIRQLQLSCDKLGVRMYFEEPARSIGRSDTGTYVVLTDTYYFETDRYVLYIDK